MSTSVETPSTKGENRVSSAAEWFKYGVLGLMYMAQTFPAGFVGALVPTIYREQGLPLEMFWVFSIPLIPYWFRWVWAPIVDSYGSARFGRRKSWFVPTTILAVGVYMSLALVDIGLGVLGIVITILFVKSLVTATQEVAIDAYMVDNLTPQERSRGAAIVSMFEVFGHMTALAVLGMVYEAYGWRIAVVLASFLMLLFLLPGFVRREPPLPAATLERWNAGERPSLIRFLKRRDSRVIGPLLIFAGLYTGATVPLIGPFLVDRGYSVGQVGVITGVTLFSAVMVGSVLGMVLLKRYGIKAVLSGLLVVILPASVPLVSVVWMDLEVSTLAIGALVGLPTTVLAVFSVALNTLRLGFASKLQAGTDYSIGGALSRIGQTASLAAGGVISAYAGWSGFWFVHAIVGICVLYVGYLAHDWLEAEVAARNERETGIGEALG